MIFRPDLAEKVVRGEKTVTRRLCSFAAINCVYGPGELVFKPVNRPHLEVVA